MKKLLLGTSAIVAAGLLSTGAMAQDGFTVTVSGFFNFSAALISQDDGVGQPGEFMRDNAFGQDSEIIFQANQTLDNGTRVRATIELEGETGSDQIDETFLRFSNDAWGTLELGSRDNAANKMTVFSPIGVGAHLIGCTTFAHATAPGAGNVAGFYCVNGAGGDSIKINYFTPVINGFRLGVSYEPEPGIDGGAGAITGAPSADSAAPGTAGAFGEQYSVAAEYINTFGDVSFRGMVGFTHSEQEVTPTAGSFLDDFDLWHTGVTLSFGAFSIGGMYQSGEVNQNTGTAVNGDDTRIRITATYSVGPWLLGGGWSERKVEDRIVGGVNGEDKLTNWGASVRRSLGPGVQVSLGFRNWTWEDDDNAIAAENDASHVFFATNVNF